MEEENLSSGVWGCSCGTVAYGTNPPIECDSCDAMSSFAPISEDQAAEKMEEKILSANTDLDEEDEE
tara:strand:- start:2134 stop:2334 length:201 start_codon:yes stop_codon:yes gene_type:complete